MIGPMVVAALSTQMEMFTKESGKMTKPMDMEFTLVLINLITLDSGVMTFSMDMAQKSGMTVLLMKGSIFKALSRVMENLFGQMDLYMRVTLRKI